MSSLTRRMQRSQQRELKSPMSRMLGVTNAKAKDLVARLEREKRHAHD